METKRKYIIIIWLIVLIWFALFFYFFFQKKISTPTVSFENIKFNVEIADSDEERTRGLMYRESLWEKSAMIFVFPKTDIHSFWMKNTLIPLDMIWIKNEWGKSHVVDIQTALPCEQDPCRSYIPVWIADYVLEINAGLAEKYNIKKWDLVEINLE